MPPEIDYLLVGGGLQNGLIALALLHRHPNTRIQLLERDDRLGGDHTWSFHLTDIPLSSRDWFDPIVVAAWPKAEVRFPNRYRVYNSGYGSILSHRFHQVVSRAFEQSTNSQLRLSCNVAEVHPHRVILTNGESIDARWVIDSRGRVQEFRGTGYQKFVGWEVELAQGTFPSRPVVMNALVPQRDGFRFVYILPFSQQHGLIEDTVFSNSATLHQDEMRRSIIEYMHDQGYVPRRLIREETGVLPMPWRSPRSRPVVIQPGLLLGGYRGGWFHPATGYSLPIACRLAQTLADHHGQPSFLPAIELLLTEHQKQSRFARLLNRLLFSGFAPEESWHVFERFYGFPQETIERFYRLRLTAVDRKLLVCGQPPKGFSVRAFLRFHSSQLISSLDRP
jgi:lycopene beta-cyclase